MATATSTTKTSTATTSPAKKAPVKTSPAKKTAVKTSPAKKAPAKTSPAKKTAPDAELAKKRVAPAMLSSSLGSTVGKVRHNGLLGEFRQFINRGNVVDLAVAFVMGAAFKTVVDSLAGTGTQAGILGGLIGAIFGGEQPDFSQKVLTLNGSDIPLGAFVTATINFVLVAAAMFVVVKAYNRFRDAGDGGGAAPTTNDLLAEIRDELRAARPRTGRRGQ